MIPPSWIAFVVLLLACASGALLFVRERVLWKNSWFQIAMFALVFSGALLIADFVHDISAMAPPPNANTPEAENAQGMSAFQRQDYTTAMQWFQKAAAQGDANAEDNIGGIYEAGDGVPQDYAQAFQWFQKAAGQNNAPGESDLAWLYFGGLGVPRDYAQALQWYQKAAAQGNATAENQIGWIYQFGLGVQRNYATAAYWYQKAATQGSPAGEDNIGYLYEKGLGIPKDTATAIQWYQKAAAQGNDVGAQQTAKMALARLHAGG